MVALFIVINNLKHIVMAIAKFHSFRGANSALIMVKANAFVFNSTAVYVPKEAIPAGMAEGASFEIPDGYAIAPFVDHITGEVRTTKDGQPLNILVY